MSEEEKYPLRIVKIRIDEKSWVRFKTCCARHNKPVLYILRCLVKTWTESQEQKYQQI